MKVAVGVLAVVLLFAAVAAEAQTTRTFERTVPLGSGGSLDLTSSRGSVKLTGWDRNEVEIRARIEADSDFTGDYARRAVEATTVDVLAGSSGVLIRPNFDNVPVRANGFFGEWRPLPRIHFEIRAPRRLDIRLDVDRSDTVLSGFEGRIVLESDRSEVDAADLTGAIRARMDRAGDSKFSNIRGSMTVVANRTNLQIGFLRLESVSRIEIDRGDADVSVMQGQGFDFSTNLSRRANFDTNLALPYRSRNRDNPSGSVNGGGPRLQIDADRSNVRLRS
jgi:hypothetical protein